MTFGDFRGLASSPMQQGHLSSIALTWPKNVSIAGEAAKVLTRVKVSSQACPAVIKLWHYIWNMFLSSTARSHCKVLRKRSRLMRKFRCTEPKPRETSYNWHSLTSSRPWTKLRARLKRTPSLHLQDARSHSCNMSACGTDLRMLPLAARGWRHYFGKLSGWHFNAGVITCSTRTGT